MTHKKLTKLLAIGLVAVMAVMSFASCDGGSSDGDETSAQTGDNVVNEDDPEGELVETLYGKYDYDGQKFRILALGAGDQWYTAISDTANEVWFEESGSEVLQRSIYERNKATEKLLNVEITPVWGGGGDQVIEKVNQAALAAQDDFDAAFASLAGLMTSASNGNLLNFNDFEEFDSDHSWWNEKFVDNITIFGTDLYVAAGAINIWDDCSNNAIIFNKDYFEYYNCDDPYQQVFDGTWTIENQRATIQKCTQDTNGDGDMDDSDNWGIAGIGILLYNGMFGLDTGITELNSEGVPELICMTEEHLTKVQAFFDVVMNSEGFYEQGIPGETAYQDLFINGQSGMMYSNLISLFGLREMEEEYGILPLAKYNEEQAEYTGSVNSEIYTCYGIPKSCNDPQMAIVCLETMSGYSVNTLDKSLHDILFESKLTRDKESRQILQIIKETISFDWAYVGDWRGILVGIYDFKSGWDFTLASKLEAEYTAAETRLEEMINNFRDRSSTQ